MSGLVKFDHEGFRTSMHLDILELSEEGFQSRGYWNDTLELIHPDPGEPHYSHGGDLSNTTFIVLIALVSSK